MQLERELRNISISEFYSANYAWLFGWLRKKTGCAYDAADLTQDTFLRVITKQNLSALQQPRAFLTTVAHGLMVSLFRRRDLEAAYLNAISHLAEADSPSPETRTITLQTLIKIDEMLAGLPVKVRRAFLLSQLEGLSHAEIAKRLNVSISSVRQYIAKALLHCLALP